jgi:hypothetical protein
MFHLSFDEWMRAVDAQVEALAGCNIYDLPDCCYPDWYDDGLSPREAAQRAIRNANDEEE